MFKNIRRGKPVKKDIYIPSSKSLSHRAIICASLAQGTSYLRHIDTSMDIEATIHAMELWGIRFERDDDTLIVYGKGKAGNISQNVDCGESGSTLRFLIPLFASASQPVRFIGHGRLPQRPQTVYEEIFRKQDLLFQKEENGILVQGPLKPGKFQVPGNVSSQFISGLLFALPVLQEDSEIEILPPYESQSYVNLTIAALKEAGIIVRKDNMHLDISGNQKYKPLDITVEGDDSQMAFFAAYSLMHHQEVIVKNMNHDSLQGDHVILDIFEKAGGKYEYIENGYRFLGGTPVAFEADLSNCPDLGPILFALAAVCPGQSVIHNIQRLRIKESDRAAAMEEELSKLGCKIHTDERNAYIQGGIVFDKDCVLSGHNDHRIVMALSILATISHEYVKIDGTEAIQKSYPGFFEDLLKTGADIC